MWKNKRLVIRENISPKIKILIPNTTQYITLLKAGLEQFYANKFLNRDFRVELAENSNREVSFEGDDPEFDAMSDSEIDALKSKILDEISLFNGAILDELKWDYGTE